MKPSSLFRLLILSLISTVFFSAAARADSIGIALTETSISSGSGTTVTFDATLKNLTSGTVFLNGDSSTTSTSFLTVDDNPFLNNAPLSLAAGASSGPFPLFNVIIAAGTTPGTYNLNLFSVLGGTDGSAFNPMGGAQFSVVVSPVPEPGTIALLGIGMLGLGIRSRWRRSSRGPKI
jgi:hypothetical protein